MVCSKEDSENALIKIAKKFNVIFPKTSPDTTEIRPEKLHVSIDQVRNLRSTIYQKPVKSRFKLAIIYRAHTLTKEAQNALLKLLEEPPEHAVIILQAENKDSLLPTILSRVEIIEKNAKIEPSDIDIFSDDKEEAFEKIANVENSLEFLDALMVKLFKLLTSKKSAEDRSRIILALESAADAKKMIEANVDPRFVLTNLVFSI